MKTDSTLSVAIVPVGIVLNIFGVLINEMFNLPLFLDSIGTILTAVILGPWIGAATGFVSNLIVGIFGTPISIPFGLVNAAIGIVAGYLARRRGYEDLLTPLLLTLILTFLCPALATPLVVYLFGGVSGSGIDLYWVLMMESGHRIFSSAFLVRLPANLADKLISTYLVLGIIRFLPRRWKGIAARPEPDIRLPAEER